jgi:hypothetical protein
VFDARQTVRRETMLQRCCKLSSRSVYPGVLASPSGQAAI